MFSVVHSWLLEVHEKSKLLDNGLTRGASYSILGSLEEQVAQYMEPGGT